MSSETRKSDTAADDGTDRWVKEKGLLDFLNRPVEWKVIERGQIEQAQKNREAVGGRNAAEHR